MTDFLKTLYAYGVLSHISFFINGCKVTKKREQNKKNILFFAEKGIKKETNFLKLFFGNEFPSLDLWSLATEGTQELSVILSTNFLNFIFILLKEKFFASAERVEKLE
jgi:hypothetical protein